MCLYVSYLVPSGVPTAMYFTTKLRWHCLVLQVEAEVKGSQFTKEAAGIASTYDVSGIHDPSVARQLHMIKDIGTDALKDEKKIKKVLFWLT